MPVVWQRDPQQRWIVLVYSDPYTFTDLERVTGPMVSDHVFRSTKRMLVDATNCAPPTPEFVREMTKLADKFRLQLSGSSVAIVVKDDATFGMARMAELLIEARQLPMRLTGFRQMETATAWLSDTAAAT